MLLVSIVVFGILHLKYFIAMLQGSISVALRIPMTDLAIVWLIKMIQWLLDCFINRATDSVIAHWFNDLEDSMIDLVVLWLV